MPSRPESRQRLDDVERLEALLREARTENARLARLAAFPEQNPNPALEVDFDGRVRYANPAARGLFPDLAEKGAAHPWLSGWEDEVRSLSAGPATTSTRVVTIGGSSWHQVLVRVPGEAAIRLYGFDVTDRIRAEELQRESHADLQRVFDVRTVGVMFWDLNTGVMTDANDAFLDIMGYSRREVEARELTWQTLTPPEYMDVSRAEVQKFLTTGRIGPYEKEYLRKDGTRQWFVFAGSSLGHNRCVEFCVDISARKRAEAEVRRSEQQFRVLTENLVSGVALVDERGAFLIVNRSFLRLFDLDENTDVLNLNSRDWSQWRVFDESGTLLDVDEHPARKAMLSRHAVKDKLVGMQAPTRADLKWLLVSAEPILDDRGDIHRLICTYHDITAYKRAEEALRESEERYRTLFESMDEGFCIIEMLFDEHGKPVDYRFLDTNPAFVAQTGLVHARGRTVRELVPQHEEHWFETYGRVAVTGQSIRFENQAMQLKPPRWYDVYAFRYGPAERRQVAVLFTDIASRKRAEEDVRRANLALAEADRRKDEFIAVLSHELRNPLAPIRYALPLLAEERLGAAGRRATGVIDRQVTHLSRLVDDLLDVSRITAGKIELRREYVALGSVVSSAVEAASPAIAAGRHSLDISVPEAPAWLHIDAARISQAITNLLNNSAKYTPQGGRIRLEAAADEAIVTLRVIDNGIGLAPEALTTVFEMFRQASDRTRAQGGLGVGLTLAKQLVEMHGGTIEARSEGPGRGAEFLVRLPLAAAAGRANEERTPAASSRPACLRVLVVDDNVDLVDMLAMLVEAAGHQVRTALDGRSAISAALEYQPSLILLDVGMPDMNGMEVAKELRRHAALRRTRIVALTGWGQAEDRRRTAEAGFDDHLTKPADPRQIQRILEEVAVRLKA